MTSPAKPVPLAASQIKTPAVDGLLVLGVVAFAAAMIRGAFFTPPDAAQGMAQKIFYVHAPSAFVALYCACGLVFICSALWLWLKDERLDRVAEASTEVGLAFMTVVLITGPLWGRPIWGAWWTWDARLTLSLFLWFVLLGYQILRGAVEEPEQRARFSAVLGVLAGLLVPFIHLSVYLFRTLHPMPIVLKPSSPSLSNEMLTSFLFSMTAIILLFFGLVRARYRLAIDRAELEHLEARR
jgi:heme exporter protein C